MVEKNTVENKSFDIKNIIVIVLAVILIAFVFLFFMQRSEHNTIISQLNTEKDSIRTELETMLVDYDSLKTENETINEDLLVTQTQIKDLLNEVQQVKKASFQEVSSYRKQVTTLRGIMKSLYFQIDSLNESNKLLYAENLEVKQQISEEKERSAKLVKDNKRLEQTLDKGKILEALNLSVIGLNPRNKPTNRVARTLKLQVSFTLSKNILSKRGDKTVYIRIQRPDQLLMEADDKGTFNFEGSKIPYSEKRTVTYEGKELPVNIYWDNTGKESLNPGTYIIDVFTDGYNIGTQTFVLRK